MYISETANPSSRGALNIMFQLFCTIGILIASGINYGAILIPHDKSMRSCLLGLCCHQLPCCHSGVG